MKSNDKSELPEEGFYEDQNVTRDRKNFSKHLLRHFLKNALTKELWIGAPWIVKEGMAREFDLPLEVPPHLQQSARVAEKKALAQQKKAAMGLQDPDQGGGMFTITDFRSSQNGRKKSSSHCSSGNSCSAPPLAEQTKPKAETSVHSAQYSNLSTWGRATVCSVSTSPSRSAPRTIMRPMATAICRPLLCTQTINLHTLKALFSTNSLPYQSKGKTGCPHRLHRLRSSILLRISMFNQKRRLYIVQH